MMPCFIQPDGTQFLMSSDLDSTFQFSPDCVMTDNLSTGGLNACSDAPVLATLASNSNQDAEGFEARQWDGYIVSGNYTTIEFDLKLSSGQQNSLLDVASIKLVSADSWLYNVSA